MAQKKKTETQALSFEEQLACLDELVTRMEQGDRSLKDMLADYEQGMALAGALDQQLTGARARLEVLRGGVPAPMEETRDDA